MGMTCGMCTEEKKCIHGLAGRTRHTCEDNVKTYVKEKNLEGVEWIQVAWDREKLWTVVKTVMKGWNFSSIRGTVSLSSMTLLWS